MADEDPYNFEIAIPAAAGGGRAQAASYGRYGASSSGEEDDGDDDGSVDVSDLDGDEEEEEDRKASDRRASTATSRAEATTAKPVVRTATTGGGGSALDKAKSFLSKYSSKSVETKAAAAPASSQRSRVELSLDDDELSLDSSRDVSRRANSADDREHDTSSYSEDESPVKTKVEATTKPLRTDSGRDEGYNEREDEYDEESDAPPPYSVPPAAAVVSTPAYTSANQWKPTTIVLSQQANYDQEEEERSLEAESVASQSEILESQEQSDYHHETPQPVTSQVTRASVMDQSAPSESGVYEEEAFEEESVQASPVARSAVQSSYVEPKQATVTATAAKPEPTFDYSMDFSDDGDTEKQSAAPTRVEPLPAAPTVRVEHAPTPHSYVSDDYESEGERSALLESDSNSHESQHVDAPSPVSSRAPPASTIALPLSKAPTDDTTDNVNEHVFALSIQTAPDRAPVAAIEPAKAAETEYEHQATPTPYSARSITREEEEEDLVGAVPTLKQEDIQECPIQQQGAATPTDIDYGKKETASASTARSQSHSDRPRPRVLIVRAYETAEAKKPETKDASTQFTGNHAGIQTELVPDGMHNLQEPQRSTPAAYEAQEQRREACEAQEQRRGACEAQEQRREAYETTANPAPSPPPSQASTNLPTAGSMPLLSYSLDMLQQPLTTSTSLYKQQLVALQEQILLKKRETERLVSERMIFQYGSLRGTERFIAGRRPPKLQLWEALMRVDPTLDEKKAKEAARLAQGGFTA